MMTRLQAITMTKHHLWEPRMVLKNNEACSWEQCSFEVRWLGDSVHKLDEHVLVIIM